MVRYIEKNLPVFWGCTLIQSLPYLMEDTREVFRNLNINLVEIKNASCCPDPTYLAAYGEETSLGISARNLALAEELANELLVICNGCYVTLKSANDKLAEPNIREKINSLLRKKYTGKLEINHVLGELHSNLKEIKSRVKRSLSGLRVAVHYGCHAVFPPVLEVDRKEPRSLDELVEATGAESIDYEEKFTCCGVPILAYDPRRADELLLRKLREIKGKADCIVTTCPGCFLRFDMPNPKLEEYKIPVLHLSELLLLSFGYPPEKLHLNLHMTSTDKILERISEVKENELEIVKKYFDLGLLNAHCGACSNECTLSIVTKNDEEPFDPLITVNKLLEGKLSEVLESKDIWRCLQCGKCEVNCPSNIGLKDMFKKLRELAIEKGKVPRIVGDKVKLFERSGYAMPTRISVRKKMGLPMPEKIEVEEIREIIEKTRR